MVCHGLANRLNKALTFALRAREVAFLALYAITHGIGESELCKQATAGAE